LYAKTAPWKKSLPSAAIKNLSPCANATLEPNNSKFAKTDAFFV